MVLSIKMAVFWVAALCLHHHPDGGGKHVWNDCKFLPEYEAQQPRWQPVIYTLDLNSASSRYLWVVLGAFNFEYDFVHIYCKKFNTIYWIS